MVDIVDKENSQQELFDDFLQSKKRKNFFNFKKKPTFPQHRFTIILTYERFLLIIISLIVVVIIFFSLGVEKGKKYINLADKTKEPLQSVVVNVQKMQTNTAVQKNIPKETNQNVIKPKIQILPKVQSRNANTSALPTSSSNKPYTIQLVTYIKKDLAQKEITILKNEGYNVFVVPSGDFFQVCVGLYGTKENALKDWNKLRKRYKDCYIRKR